MLCISEGRELFEVIGGLHLWKLQQHEPAKNNLHFLHILAPQQQQQQQQQQPQQQPTTNNQQTETTIPLPKRMATRTPWLPVLLQWFDPPRGRALNKCRLKGNIAISSPKNHNWSITLQ